VEIFLLEAAIIELTKLARTCSKIGNLLILQARDLETTSLDAM